MIQANELRIGNYVMLADKGLYQIDCGHDIDEIDGFPEGDIYCEPIPITEQWLIDFGFKKFSNQMFRLDSLEIEFYKESKIAEVQWYENAPLESVHQLQNLYFAITGKELTLTSK